MHDDVPLAEPAVTCRAARTAQAEGSRFGDPPWDGYNALVYTVGALIVEAESLAAPARITASLALAAMIPWYLFIGRPLMRLDEARWEQLAVSWRASAYLAGLVALFAVAQHENTNAWFLSFALSPQCFHVTTTRRAMVFVVVLNVIAGVQVALDNPNMQGVVIALGIGILGIAFSLAYSAWAMRVVRQSRERAALIAQLESTRAELAAAHHEAGVLSERHRLATEIHDTLAQGFTSIVTLVQAAQASLGGASPAREHLDLALLTARDNLAESRALVAALSPAGLDGSGLGDAVTRAAQSTASEAGITVRPEIAGVRRPLPTGTEVVVLRVCQEALANVRKHACASHVDVLLRYTGAAVELAVTDDGRGFDAAVVSGGYGLRGMRERLRQAGGTLDVTTAPGGGTTIRAEVPG